MAKQRKVNAEYRNVRLKRETYDKLDRYLLKLRGKQGSNKLTLDDAVGALLIEKAENVD